MMKNQASEMSNKSKKSQSLQCQKTKMSQNRKSEKPQNLECHIMWTVTKSEMLKYSKCLKILDF